MPLSISISRGKKNPLLKQSPNVKMKSDPDEFEPNLNEPTFRKRKGKRGRTNVELTRRIQILKQNVKLMKTQIKI